MFANKKLVVFSVLLRQIILIVVLPWSGGASKRNRK